MNYNTAPGARKMRVAIIGSGAAGLSAAWNLSHNPEKFEVDVWEKDEGPGGVATSKELDNGNYINDGVQGGSPVYRNTINLMQAMGMQCAPVKMKFSFGKDENAWNNTYDSDLQERFRSEISRFETVVKVTDALKFLFAFIPIKITMKLFRFSDDFANLMVYPIVALFFGTGNQSDRVSTTLVTQVFMNSQARMFDYDKERMVSEPADMIAFPKLGEFYERVQKDTEKSGNVKFFFKQPVGKIIRKNGTVQIISHDGRKRETYDRLIMACDAETALKLLEEPSYLEKTALGNVEYYNDITITHTDIDYMKSKNDLSLDDRNDQYFIHQYSPKSSLMEMSFCLNNYQPQLSKKDPTIFQTIFLNDQVRDQWTIDEIDKDKIIGEKWWRQFSHAWKHFAFTVPLIRFIQGSGGGTTYYAGAYTIANLHELAVISGFAAAKRLGAEYPFEKDEQAKGYFDMYYMACHKLW